MCYINNRAREMGTAVYSFLNVAIAQLDRVTAS